MKPRLVVEQKITAFVNKYAIYTAGEDSEKTGLVALAQQKRLAFKEKVLFYTDEQKSKQAFSFHAEKVMDIHGRYFVEDASGKQIGVFKKDFTQSLLNSTWNILDAHDEVKFIIKESNQTLAILRRFTGYIPFIGDIAELILLFFRYHFVFIDPKTNEIVGKYQKTTLLRDHYLLSMTDEHYNQEDWEVFAAMAVALDALQSR